MKAQLALSKQYLVKFSPIENSEPILTWHSALTSYNCFAKILSINSKGLQFGNKMDLEKLTRLN